MRDPDRKFRPLGIVGFTQVEDLAQSCSWDPQASFNISLTA